MRLISVKMMLVAGIAIATHLQSAIVQSTNTNPAVKMHAKQIKCATPTHFSNVHVPVRGRRRAFKTVQTQSGDDFPTHVRSSHGKKLE